MVHKQKILSIVTALTIGGFILFYVLSGYAPWTPTGTLVVVVQAVPTLDATTTLFSIGIDDILLRRDDGKTRQASILTHRANLTPQNDTLVELFHTTIPTGTYRGVDFRLTSPELQNDWKGTLSPEQVSLPHEQVSLPVAYTVTEDATTVLLISFETTQAIYDEGNQHVYLPVVHVETRVGATLAREGETLTIADGTIHASQTFGMDKNGTMRLNYREPLVTHDDTPLSQPYIETVEERAPTIATTTESATTSTETTKQKNEKVASSTKKGTYSTEPQ